MTARNVPSMATVAAVLATAAAAMSSTPPVADGQLSGQYYSTAMLMQPKCSSEIKVEKGWSCLLKIRPLLSVERVWIRNAFNAERSGMHVFGVFGYI